VSHADTIRRYSQRIVERDCHVSATQKEAARHVMRRAAAGAKGYRKTWTRAMRHALQEGVLAGRRSNWKLYRFATGSV
jgi:hypothetical protein